MKYLTPDERAVFDDLCDRVLDDPTMKNTKWKAKAAALDELLDGAAWPHDRNCADLMREESVLDGLAGKLSRRQGARNRVVIADGGELHNRKASRGIRVTDDTGQLSYQQTLLFEMSWDEFSQAVDMMRQKAAEMSVTFHGLQRVAKLRDLAPDSFGPADAAASLGTTIQEVLATDPSGHTAV